MSFKPVHSTSRFFLFAKVACLLVAFAVSNLMAQGRQSFFGTTGLSFIPTAELLPPGTVGASYSTRPAVSSEVNLTPYSVRLGMGFSSKAGRMEVAFTNTWLYASTSLGLVMGLDTANIGVNVMNTGVPLVPSFKYQVVAMDPATNNSAMAFGLTSPYGVFYAYDKYLSLRFLHVTFHAGIATKLITYHAFTGATVYFGSAGPGYKHSVPIRLMFEGSWGGSLKNLKEKEESFWAVTSIYQWTKNLTLETYVRFDSGYGPHDPSKRMGIGLGYVGGFR